MSFRQKLCSAILGLYLAGSSIIGCAPANKEVKKPKPLGLEEIAAEKLGVDRSRLMRIGFSFRDEKVVFYMTAETALIIKDIARVYWGEFIVADFDNKEKSVRLIRINEKPVADIGKAYIAACSGADHYLEKKSPDRDDRIITREEADGFRTNVYMLSYIENADFLISLNEKEHAERMCRNNIEFYEALYGYTREPGVLATLNQTKEGCEVELKKLDDALKGKNE